MRLKVDSDFGFDFVQPIEVQSPKVGCTRFNPIDNSIITYNGYEWLKGEEWIGGMTGLVAGGNQSGADNSSINRIIFPFDNGVSTNIANLAITGNLGGVCGFNSSNYGYVAQQNGTISGICRFNFSLDETVSTRLGNLTYSRYSINQLNNNFFGYMLGGYIGTTPFSYMERLLFSSDTVFTSIGNLAVASYGGSGCNSSIHGYILGGGTVSATFISNIQRLTFPNESGTITSVGTLSTTKAFSATFNSSLHGYSMGGWNTSYLSLINRLTFPFDSGSATSVGNMTQSIHNCAGVNSNTEGFGIAGNNGSSVSTIEKIAFPFDSGNTTKASNLSITMYYGYGIDNSDFVTQFTS